MAGSRRSPARFSAERCRGRAGAVVLALVAGTVVIAQTADTALAQAPLRPYMIVGDAIPASLTGMAGDPERGRAIVVNRQVGLCLLCHSGPFPQERFQGTLAPDLKGAGARSSEGQLRLRIVDASLIKPDTIMPPYYRVDGLERVAPSFTGKPILTAEQIEDVVAYLMTLRD
jgi:sulfur-oxidizing protein SoxX